MRASFSLFAFSAVATALVIFPNYAAPAKPSPPKFKLAFVTNNPSDYWIVARKGVEKAEKELGIQVDFQIPPNGDTADQAYILRNLLGQGVQGIAVSPVDPDNQTALLNTVASKTLLFTQDADAPSSNRVCFVGTDNVAAGRQAGEELKRVLPYGGNIVVCVGKKDARNASDRIQGLKESLEKTNIKVLDILVDYTDRSRAKANVSDTLIKYPKLAACVGIWSYNGPAILSAVKDAHKTGKVKIVCFDEEEDTLEGVKHGQISATVVQQPFEFGYQSIINMAKYLGGDKSVVPPNQRVLIHTLVIRRDTVDAFAKDLAQKRGPNYR